MNTNALALRLLRVTAGLMIAFIHGWHKVVGGYLYMSSGQDWPLLNDTMALGFPCPVFFSAIAATVQFAGGLLIAAGVATRPAAVLVAFTMMTALIFNIRTADSDAQLAGLYALIAIVVAIADGSTSGAPPVCGASVFRRRDSRDLERPSGHAISPVALAR